jgi:hypothetical protein
MIEPQLELCKVHEKLETFPPLQFEEITTLKETVELTAVKL